MAMPSRSLQVSPMPPKLILVRALWDEETHVWVATTDDVPGLATEAETLQALRDKLIVMIPELMQANSVVSELSEIPIHIVAEMGARIRNPQAGA